MYYLRQESVILVILSWLLFTRIGVINIFIVKSVPKSILLEIELFWVMQIFLYASSFFLHIFLWRIFGLIRGVLQISNVIYFKYDTIQLQDVPQKSDILNLNILGVILNFNFAHHFFGVFFNKMSWLPY